MNLMSLAAHSRLWVAIVAALSFALGLLVACTSSLGFLPDQHPLGLLGALPGAEGGLYRVLLYWLPAAASLWVALGLWQDLQADRSGRLAVMLVAIAATGFGAMGSFPLVIKDAAGTGAGLHAAAWLIWLAAWLAALCLLSVALFQRGSKVAAVLAGGLAGVTLVLAAGLDGLFSGPVAQLLCWGAWLAAQVALAAGRPQQTRGY